MTTQPLATQTASGRQIVLAVIGSIVLAALILVGAVLPAEYSIDPLKIGRVFGLTALSEGGGGAITPQTTDYKRDVVEFVLGPYEFLEYKYRLARGASMLFSWEATRTVSYDFHSEPEGGPKGYAESFDKRDSDRAAGTYTAPFNGIHGWYWENGGGATVTIRLTSAGFYTEALEFFTGRTFPHQLLDARSGTRAAE